MESNTNIEKMKVQINEAETAVFRLPNLKIKDLEINQKNFKTHKLAKICKIINYLTSNERPTKNVFFIGSLYLMPFVYHSIDKRYHFQYLVAIRTKNVKNTQVTNNPVGTTASHPGTRNGLNRVTPNANRHINESASNTS